jgi:quercetin dioxygenase-like cupin family protein
VHHLQEEVLTVESGTMGWKRAGEPDQVARAGETIAFKPGEAHRFWNAGDDDLVAMGRSDATAASPRRLVR